MVSPATRRFPRDLPPAPANHQYRAFWDYVTQDPTTGKTLGPFGKTAGLISFALGDFLLVLECDIEIFDGGGLEDFEDLLH